MLTLKQVNKAIKERGGEEQLYKGEGYYYFIEGEALEWETVPVFGLNHLTLQGWIDEWEARAERLEMVKSFKAPAGKKDFYVEATKDGVKYSLRRVDKEVFWTPVHTEATMFTQDDHVEDLFEVFPELKSGYRHLKFW